METDTDYDYTMSSNSSRYRDLLTRYINCTMSVSQTYNISVSEQVWHAIFQTIYFDNTTAGDTFTTNSDSNETNLKNVHSTTHSYTTMSPIAYNLLQQNYDVTTASIIDAGYKSQDHEFISNTDSSSNLSSLTPTASGYTSSYSDLIESNFDVLNAVSNWCLGADVAPDDRPYLLPWWLQLLWTLAFGVMLTVAIGGNSLVMWIVCGRFPFTVLRVSEDST